MIYQWIPWGFPWFFHDFPPLLADGHVLGLGVGMGQGSGLLCGGWASGTANPDLAGALAAGDGFSKSDE